MWSHRVCHCSWCRRLDIRASQTCVAAVGTVPDDDVRDPLGSTKLDVPQLSDEVLECVQLFWPKFWFVLPSMAREASPPAERVVLCVTVMPEVLIWATVPDFL